MKALLWLGHLILDTTKWIVTITVVGLWFGFFHYVGWDAARTLLPFLLGIVHPR